MVHSLGTNHEDLGTNDKDDMERSGAPLDIGGAPQDDEFPIVVKDLGKYQGNLLELARGSSGFQWHTGRDSAQRWHR